jgi:hypothetical protein
MKSLLFLISALFSFSVIADQAATLTCTGATIILEVKSPYLGENSPQAQKLYILKMKSYGDLSSYSAFFLDVEESQNAKGEVFISGKNNKGGTFFLKTSAPVDVSDGTTIHEVSHGNLTFDHGPLRGAEEVFCSKE